ncbi:MAG: RHS repeat-associated core domain-containing protein [Polyangiaceae bacterium]
MNVRDLTNDNVDDCSTSNRWMDNPMEALKGLPIVTEKRDLSGRTLSTDITQYELRTLYQGRDGRGVRQAVATATRSYVYDTTASFTSAGTDLVTVVNRRDLAASTTSGALPTAGALSPLISKAVPLRSSTYSRIDGATEVDFFGNQVIAVKYGCTAGCADSDAGGTQSSDEVLTQITVPGGVTDDESGWLFRTVGSWTTGSLHGSNRYGFSRTEYDSSGNPKKVYGEHYGAVALLRDHAPSAATSGDFELSGTEYDAYGNPTRVTGAGGRCTDLTYDTAYASLPVTETVYAGAGCSNPLGMQASAYDRGLGLVTIAVDINSQTTKVEYDGFGRTKALYKPNLSASTYSTKASVLIDYYLPPSLGSNVSAIRTRTQDGATVDDETYLESWVFVDGFGRTRSTLTEADKTAGDGGDWVVSGLVTHDAKGAVQRKHVEYFWDGSAEGFPIATQPTTPYGSQRYDAFGRAIQTFDLDGTMTLKTVYHALSTNLWDASDSQPGPHAGTYASARKDGHGRTVRTTERVHAGNSIEAHHVLSQYNPAGQVEVLTRQKNASADASVSRWMLYDSLGRMVLNVDPHTTQSYTGAPSQSTDLSTYVVPTGLRAWRYQYNLAGDLIATEDARGCGVNFGYDALGRLLGEDYVPCETHHQPYSAPSTDRKSGWEVAYYYDAVPSDGPHPPGWDESTVSHFTKGRLVAVRDRASETWTDIDGRGRVIATSRRVAAPADGNEVVPNTILDRYTSQWFVKRAAYDGADRAYAETVGGVSGANLDVFNGTSADVFAGDAQDKQVIRTNYSRRGVIANVGGSYGALVSSIARRADGLVDNLVYGDAAHTTTATAYDDRRRPMNIMTFRAGASIWSSLSMGAGKPDATYLPAPQAAGTPTSFQLLLEDTSITYDAVGNPTEIRDWREPSEWPEGAKPVSKKIDYDDLNRVARIDYQYHSGSGVDAWKSPFEQENTESDDTRDVRRAKPVPQLQFVQRPNWQRYEYDWLGNLTESDDDAHGGWDRSLGDQSHDSAGGRPYRFTASSNASQASGQGFAATTVTAYDLSGNLTRLGVVRPSGKCLPGGSFCTQEYAYDWDEVGRLVRARRWDSNATTLNVSGVVPSGAPAIDLRYRYDSSDTRVLKRVYAANSAEQRHSLYVFGSFEVRRTVFTNGAYAVGAETAVPYAMANGVRLARLHYTNRGEPQIGYPAGVPENFGGVPQLHVLLELGDHLGSTGTVLDKASGELVEKASYLAYGAKESDYRAGRWQGFREDYGFTGKEEDVEVGLVYFGKRFLSPQLGRWVSPDPLAVHAPGEADLNLYAYVKGAVLKSVDPVGLKDEAKTSTEQHLMQSAFDLSGGVLGQDYRSEAVPAPTGANVPSGSTAQADPNAGGGGSSGASRRNGGGEGTSSAAKSSTFRESDPALEAAATVGASCAPGVGEAMDIQTILDKHSKGWEKGLAVVSIVGNGLSGGILPNFGALKIANEAMSHVDEAADAIRAAGDAPTIAKRGEAAANLGPLKNASGDLDVAANAARTQPRYTPVTVHARQRMATRNVSSERVIEASNHGTTTVTPGLPEVSRTLKASESASGRGIKIVQDIRTNNVITVIDKGSR